MTKSFSPAMKMLVENNMFNGTISYYANSMWTIVLAVICKVLLACDLQRWPLREEARGCLAADTDGFRQRHSKPTGEHGWVYQPSWGCFSGNILIRAEDDTERGEEYKRGTKRGNSKVRGEQVLPSGAGTPPKGLWPMEHSCWSRYTPERTGAHA